MQIVGVFGRVPKQEVLSIGDALKMLFQDSPKLYALHIQSYKIDDTNCSPRCVASGGYKAYGVFCGVTK